MKERTDMDLQERLEVEPEKNRNTALRTVNYGYWLGWLVVLIIGVGLCLFPLMVDRYTLAITYTLFISVALAQSWNLIGGYTGLVSLGHAAFFGLGAYTTALLLTRMSVPFFFGIFVSGLIATAFAVAISIPMFRFRGIYFTIGTLVLAEALRIWMINWSLTGGAEGIHLPLSTIPDNETFYYFGLILAAVTTGILVVILRTKLGIGLRAIRDNEDAAQNMGVNTFRVKLVAFAISAFIAGMTGGVHAVYLGTIEPYSIFAVNWTTTAINIVIIGGIGTIFAPIIGEVFSLILSEALKDYQTIHLIITGLMLILIIRFLPTGIWGQLSKWLKLSMNLKALRRA